MVEEQPQPKQKTKEKLFRLTPEGAERLTLLTQYAFKEGYIQHPSLQEFIGFAINTVDEILKKHHEEKQVVTRTRAII